MSVPRDALAVMESHAPAIVAGDDPQKALYRALNYFPTPPWAARAGGELIQRLDPGRWTCWEPACGEGHMVHGLRDYFGEIFASDIHEFDGGVGWVIDFLEDRQRRLTPDWIVTNPPFSLGEAFVRVALKRARRGVAMLLRLAFLESEGRWSLFYGDQPLSILAPFSERVPMLLGRWAPSATYATAIAWFVWLKPEVGGGLGRLMSIPPGTKVRLTRPDDAERFGVAADAPLLEAL
jgi:hypothetical protein